MGTPGDQLYFKKSQAAVVPKGIISCLNGKCSRCFFFLYCYFITFFIFMQIPFDIFFILYYTFYQTAVKFVKCFCHGKGQTVPEGRLVSCLLQRFRWCFCHRRLHTEGRNVCREASVILPFSSRYPVRYSTREASLLSAGWESIPAGLLIRRIFSSSYRISSA